MDPGSLLILGPFILLFLGLSRASEKLEIDEIHRLTNLKKMKDEVKEQVKNNTNNKNNKNNTIKKENTGMVNKKLEKDSNGKNKKSRWPHN